MADHEDHVANAALPKGMKITPQEIFVIGIDRNEAFRQGLRALSEALADTGG